MKKNLILLLFLPAVLLAGKTSQSIIGKVNPFIGTGFHGHTYPGATTPFGAVQLSPDTRRGNWDACSGYHYSDSTLFGFSHTHLNGTGCLDLGDILIHPSTENTLKAKDGHIFSPLSFLHKNEFAQAGYYRVKLDNGIQAELTATAHSGIHRYTFPTTGKPKVVIDLAHLLDNETIKEAELQRNATEISGMRCTKGWVDNQYVYFVAQFSSPFEAQFVSNGKFLAATKSLKGTNLQAVLSFPGSNGKAVVVKVGLSSVSIDNARKNLQAEVVDFDFNHIKNTTQQQWEKALSAYQISGGTPEQLTNFYTAAYHTMVTPNIISDVNGEYRGADMRTYQSANNKVYSTFSIWDTFRAWNPLMTITNTTLVNATVNSFLNFFDQTGELPIWPLSSGETGCMIGYHSVSVIWDAYSKNIKEYDVEKAFRAMKVSAEKNSKGTASFLELGFIPADSKKESVSSLLECAYDDWCIAQMAKALGHTADYEHYTKKAQLYKNVFDGKSRFFRGRLRDGLWEDSFNPMEVGRAYTEATAWQYRFFVPQDVKGMINLFGGKAEFNAALDSLFTVSTQTIGHQSDITGLVGQYAHGNEPSHHMAYLYSFAGQPWKTQEMVRRLQLEMYRATPEGIIGNEDCGQMSAWYLMSSLGFYSVCPGSTQFVLNAPLFEKSILRLANGKTLEIQANNPSKNIYINEVYLNGKLIPENYISYSQLMTGGELKYVLDSKPNFKRGVASETYPYSFSQTDEVSIPFVSSDISLFNQEATVHCGSATADAKIYYTIDGSEPTEKSIFYTQPFTVNESATIKLRAFKTGFTPSAVASYQATKRILKPAVEIDGLKNGVNYQYYEGLFQKTSDVQKKGKLVKSAQCNIPTLSLALIPDHFGFIFSGYVYAPVDGVYTFTTQSDDGSLFRMDGKTVVDNDGSHGDIKAVGRIALKQGYHPYELLYFEDYEGESLKLSWIIPENKTEEVIEAKYLFIK
jgi:predicted alpha-1,2-mannosidase